MSIMINAPVIYRVCTDRTYVSVWIALPMSTCIMLITPESCDGWHLTTGTTLTSRLLSMGLGPHQYVLGYLCVLVDACFTQVGM